MKRYLSSCFVQPLSPTQPARPRSSIARYAAFIYWLVHASSPQSLRNQLSHSRYSGGCAIAALTVPYAERIDQIQRKSTPEVTERLGVAARTLSVRAGGMVSLGSLNPTERESILKRSDRSNGR